MLKRYELYKYIGIQEMSLSLQLPLMEISPVDRDSFIARLKEINKE